MSSAAAQERQVKPIYDAIDAGQHKTAVQVCNKLLKKQPTFELVKALKALALVRMNKLDEGAAICDQVLAGNPSDELLLGAMTHVLRNLNRHEDIVTMFDGAFKKFPKNGEFGAQAFMAHVRIGNWKAAQQIANKLHKLMKEDRYLYWNVMCLTLQACEIPINPTTQPILLKLALRLIESAPIPSHASPDRFYLHLSLLRDLQQYDDALKIFETAEGRALSETSLILEDLRYSIAISAGKTEAELESAKVRLIENKDRNWMTFEKLVSCTVNLMEQEGVLADTRALLNKLADEDGAADRTALLALLDLENRVKIQMGLEAPQAPILDILKRYFITFSDKSSCFEDIKSFTSSVPTTQWRSFLAEQDLSLAATSIPELNKQINVFKLQRWDLGMEDLTVEGEQERATAYLRAYIAALPLGKSLPKTELQPSDDLAILAASAYILLHILSHSASYLSTAIAVLEYALTRSTHAFQLRLLLIRLYRLIGAPSLALEHYHKLDIKQIQNDSMSHFVLERCSTFSLASIGDGSYLNECQESSLIYTSNGIETPDMVIKAFQFEKYSQIVDFITVEDRLDTSVQRDLTKMEHVRMRLTRDPLVAELVDSEMMELKFLFERIQSLNDNRDFGVLPDYQPRGQNINLQTSLVGHLSSHLWLGAWMKMYILVFQLASDIDPGLDIRALLAENAPPSTSTSPPTHVDMRPADERIRDISDEELKELTPDERRTREFVMAVALWIEPHNEYSRPPPKPIPDPASPLLASQTVNGTSSKSATLRPVTNGKASPTEPPVHLEPSEEIVKFFDDVESAFKEAAANDLPWKQLHIATLLHEGMILYTILTSRFRLGGGSKMKKGDPMMHSMKIIRERGLEACRRIAAQLFSFGEKETTQEGRRRFVEQCKPLKSSPEISSDFVLDVAQRVTIARKKVFEGIAKGIEKFCKGPGQGVNLNSTPSST